jgi:hypothetical protein
VKSVAYDGEWSLGNQFSSPGHGKVKKRPCHWLGQTAVWRNKTKVSQDGCTRIAGRVIMENPGF